MLRVDRGISLHIFHPSARTWRIEEPPRIIAFFSYKTRKGLYKVASEAPVPIYPHKIVRNVDENCSLVKKSIPCQSLINLAHNDIVM
jgi:hypothetical protein